MKQTINDTWKVAAMLLVMNAVLIYVIPTYVQPLFMGN